MNTTPSVTTAVDYCRRARRIRASFNRAPHLRHRALTDLARERNLQLLTNPTAPPTRLAGVPKGRVVKVESRPSGTTAKQEKALSVANPSATENEFAVQVAAKLQPFGFTFTDRIKLLNTAERLGINRFRANVILAMHEHQQGRPPATETAKPARSSFLLILAIECVTVAAVVWVCTL